jgi:hypothetical protein
MCEYDTHGSSNLYRFAHYREIGIFLHARGAELEQPSCPAGYGFNSSPWHAGCWHWHVSSVTPLASEQGSLQYFWPAAGTQLQAGRAHLEVAFIRAPFRNCDSLQKKICAQNLLITLKNFSNPL